MFSSKFSKKQNSGILLGRDAVQSRSLMIKHSKLLMDPNNWHAFIIRTRKKMTRNEILKQIMNYVRPYDIIPLKFEELEGANEYTFFARDCSSAIRKICVNNLIIPNPSDITSYIECEIILQHSTVFDKKISIEDRMRPIFYSCYHSCSKTLNLDNFAEKEGLADYLPLSQPKILQTALNLAVSFNPLIIRLRNNDISSLDSTEALWKFTSLTHLDLRNNKIEDLSSFSCLKGLKLTKINLDGNPLCSVMDAYTYVAELRSIFPNLQTIDGEVVQRDGSPAFKRNYLCNFDGFSLVNNFIDTYFFRYDKDRKSLEHLYHKNAMCSITNLYKTGQVTSNDARLRPYQINSRNLLAIADVTKSNQSLIIGSQCIVRKLCDLPEVEHDSFCFTTDLTFYSDQAAIISVSGVFRELPESVLQTERYVSFMRTFCLTNYNGEYLITNDMLHVYNALSIQVFRAFKIKRPPVSSRLPIPRTTKDKETAVEALKAITGLNNQWSRRLLDDHGYDIIACVKNFMDLYKVDELPINAFEQ